MPPFAPDSDYLYFGRRRSYWLPAIASLLGLVVAMQAVLLARPLAAVTLAAEQCPESLSSTTLPARFVVDGLTPSADQMNRGDCWLFATAGILEDSYRRYGVARGWFDPKKFLRLSRQALGIAVLELCADHPNSLCPSNIGPSGSIIWAETAEGYDGADEHLFAYLRGIGEIGAVPNSVCSYAPNPGKDVERECNGLSEVRKANPLHFTVSGSRTFYARDEIKRALQRGGSPLTLGIGMIWAPFYLPCDSRYGCDPSAAQCVACPLERVYRGIDCCVLSNKPMVSMKGEWFHIRGEPLASEGGHAVNIVGYSDTYRTEWGHVGGYILRNTWRDGLGIGHGLKARGSHTAAYYMQQISDGDEASVCPNLHSPRSWQPCSTVAECRSAVLRVEATNSGKALELRCIDTGSALPKGACTAGEGHYLVNTTEWGSSLQVSCFLHADESPSYTCLPPLTLDDLALIYEPVNADALPNEPLACGYNFISYETYEALQARFGGVIASSYEIEWSKESYASNAGAGSAFNYSLVTADTLDLVKLKLTGFKQPTEYTV